VDPDCVAWPELRQLLFQVALLDEAHEISHPIFSDEVAAPREAGAAKLSHYR
jgi:hypothetical protein